MAEFQWKVWKHKLFYTKCLWISYFFQIFIFIGSSVICLSLSEIPIWTHQREFGLNFNVVLYCVYPRCVSEYKRVTARRRLLVRKRVEDQCGTGGLPSSPILSGLCWTVLSLPSWVKWRTAGRGQHPPSAILYDYRELFLLTVHD